MHIRGIAMRHGGQSAASLWEYARNMVLQDGIPISMRSCLRLSTSIAAMLLLTACVDHGNKPLLLPVGTPAQPPKIVHFLCVGDADAAYNRAKEEFAKRAAMYSPGMDAGQLDEQEDQANAAARMKYISCASSQGYRAVYQ